MFLLVFGPIIHDPRRQSRRCGFLLHRVAASFKAGPACFLISGHAGLVLLRRGLPLLLACARPDDGFGRKLTAPAARLHRSPMTPRQRLRAAPRARARRGAGRRRRRRAQRPASAVGRIVLAPLHGPYDLAFVLLLLLRRLARPDRHIVVPRRSPQNAATTRAPAVAVVRCIAVSFRLRMPSDRTTRAYFRCRVTSSPPFGVCRLDLIALRDERTVPDRGP